jgi:endoplasmic reticulum junction formation protein lunapark
MSLFNRIFGKVWPCHLVICSSNSFEQNNEEDYATVLSNLAADVQKRQAKLSEIRLRERRASLQVTLYTLAAWVAYTGVWYAGLLGKNTRSSGQNVLKTIPVVVGPIMYVHLQFRARFTL